jgi:23S rRNA (cytosine1962-C5)-methyltransferase
MPPFARARGATYDPRPMQRPHGDDRERGPERRAHASQRDSARSAPDSSPTGRPCVRLDSDELERGPWIFGRQVQHDGGARDGDLVEVLDASGRFVAHALYNGASDIRLRVLSRGRRRDLDRPREFLLETLKSADRLRRRVLRLPEVTDAYRIAHAEGDDLPGLIVDRLGTWLVCDHHSLGFWNLREEVGWALGQLYPELSILHRMPSGAAKAEGCMPGDPDVDPGEVIVTENGLRYPVLPVGGHKTGWFCDQRDNRQRVASFAAGRDVADLFCNLGGFGLAAARAGARSVRSVDLDEVVLERARAAARLNKLEVEHVHMDAFHFLRELLARNERPGLVVVDPHKLIPSKNDLERGQRKYLDLNALAFECVRPGGLVATFSCSGLLTESAFVGMLFAAARRAGRGLRLLEQYGAAPDHPQRPDFSRSRYLKGALLALDPER